MYSILEVQDLQNFIKFGVSMAAGFHLIPFRTQKLSPPAANIVQR